MKLEFLTAHVLRLPFIHAHRTAFGTQTERTVLLVGVGGSDGVQGWGECLALPEPTFSPEYVEEVILTIDRVIAPRLLVEGELDVGRMLTVLRPIRGHQMAKAVVEMAILDAKLRNEGRSLASHIGAKRTKVECGVSIGIKDDVRQTIAEVGTAIERGYRRVKLNITHGHDVAPVAAIRQEFGDAVLLQVDANGSYSPEDADTYHELDKHELLLIEQPFPPDHIRAHIALAAELATPLCLDESITSAVVASDAIALGACSVINIKPGRVGGYLESLRILDICLATGTDAFIGGMYETAIAKSANLALAALPAVTLPSDIVPTSQYFRRDVTDEIELEDGRMSVPRAPGIGPWPTEEALSEFSVADIRIMVT